MEVTATTLTKMKDTIDLTSPKALKEEFLTGSTGCYLKLGTLNITNCIITSFARIPIQILFKET